MMQLPGAMGENICLVRVIKLEGVNWANPIKMCQDYIHQEIINAATKKSQQMAPPSNI